ncbi:MAG: UDP-phosphate galactose phosphotransferase [Flavobacteriales bacterium]|nr:UDP-phosphate galactose phosphotransferase [Flavobacteriales bacterium]
MKRIFDFLFAIFLLSILIIPMTLIALIIKLTSSGTVIYWSDRVGRDNNIFQMPKYRTMDINTPDVATHLLENPEEHYTPIGKILRESSLDELPQLWSIICGKMSFVGPRPALYNQDDLIKLRTTFGIEKIRPGLTGLAQINGRDELSIEEKVDLDREYMNRQSLIYDLRVISLTVLKSFRGEGISH